MQYNSPRTQDNAKVINNQVFIKAYLSSWTCPRKFRDSVGIGLKRFYLISDSEVFEEFASSSSLLYDFANKRG